jgi:ABC transport system ATP-binding/permease protein
LYLLTILIKNPNFLILDEPTNDLDITTLNVLEDFLMEFPGVLLIVSHDRFFMDKLVQHLFVLQEGGKTRDFPGNYSEYREALKKEALANSNVEKTEKPSTENAGQKERKINQVAKKEMQQIERELEKLSAERSKIIDSFATLNPTSIEFINSNKRLVEIQDRMDEIEMRWMEIVEEN